MRSVHVAVIVGLVGLALSRADRAVSAVGRAAPTRQLTDITGRVVTIPSRVTRVADPWHANNGMVLMMGAAGQDRRDDAAGQETAVVSEAVSPHRAGACGVRRSRRRQHRDADRRQAGRRADGVRRHAAAMEGDGRRLRHSRVHDAEHVARGLEDDGAHDGRGAGTARVGQSGRVDPLLRRQHPPRHRGHLADSGERTAQGPAHGDRNHPDHRRREDGDRRLDHRGRWCQCGDRRQQRAAGQHGADRRLESRRHHRRHRAERGEPARDPERSALESDQGGADRTSVREPVGRVPVGSAQCRGRAAGAVGGQNAAPQPLSWISTSGKKPRRSTRSSSTTR